MSLPQLARPSSFILQISFGLQMTISFIFLLVLLGFCTGLDLAPPTTAPRWTENQMSSITTQNPGLCSNRPDGMYPHPTDCSKFVACSNEETETFSCSTSLLFDPVLKICNFPYAVDCDVRDVCENQIGGHFPHPHDPALFIICMSGTTNIFQCPSPLVFDPEKGICDYPSQVTDPQ